MEKTSILIVDDEKTLGESLSIILQDEGYECSFTDDGFAALQYMKSHPVDILITDVYMPKMDGLTLIRKTNELNRKIAVIVITAYNDAELSEHINELDIESMLLKPLDFDEVIKNIKEVIPRRESSVGS